MPATIETAAASGRVTHVALEVRLAADEGEAIALNLAKLTDMVRRRVVSVRGDPDAMVSALEKVLDCAAMRMEPF